MDSSKLPDSRQFQQQQPPPYDPFHAHQPYDPSHAYDPSYYYHHYQHPPHQPPQPPQPQSQSQSQSYHQQYDAPYYQNYYSNSYPQQQQQHQHQQQDPYVSSGHPVNAQPDMGYHGPRGVNPAAAAAAVAALSQLTHFAGNMAGGGHYDPGYFRPPVDHTPYKGGGRRGGGPFRGGGRGYSGFRPSNAGASGPPFHGRGRERNRGRGRGRGRGGRRVPPSSANANTQAPLRNAWCEVCKVDCSTPEVLDEHNKGKRHRRNLRKLQDTKGASQPDVQTEKDTTPGSEPVVQTEKDTTPGSEPVVQTEKDTTPGSEPVVQTEKDTTPGSEPVVQTEKDTTPGSEIGPEVDKNIPQSEPDKQTEAGDDNSKVDNKVETKDNQNQEKKPRMKRKMKDKVRGTRGGVKRMRPTGPRYRKLVIPLMCDLCNIKCDTQEVFDSHSAGKKHIAKLRKFQGHQAIYGPTAVQALYPPNPLSQTLAPQPATHYGATSSYPAPPEAYIPPPYHPENPNPQLADAPLEFGTQNAVLTG